LAGAPAKKPRQRLRPVGQDLTRLATRGRETLLVNGRGRLGFANHIFEKTFGVHATRGNG
jgi:hypothetical protein